jgi:hypothetical protein
MYESKFLHIILNFARLFSDESYKSLMDLRIIVASIILYSIFASVIKSI